MPVADLDKAIDLLEKLTLKYQMLFRQSSDVHNSLLPANIDDFIQLDRIFKN